MSEPAPTSTTIRAILKPRKAMPFFGRHPWVFESAIDGVETPDGKPPAVGSNIALYSAKQEFIAHGLWNPNSIICIRLYSWNESQSPDAAFLAEKINRAIDCRRQHFDLTSESTGCRLFFSEGDGLSGLTVDYYGRFVVIQFTSAALFRFKGDIVNAVRTAISPKGIWLRTEKGMREVEGLETVDGLVEGDEPPRPLFIKDGGIDYGIDLQEGQKTGGYLDQRTNRVHAARYMKDANVLDAFCFSGGFGITAVKSGGAAKVTALDSSEAAINLAKANAELNGVADKFEFCHADARQTLEAFVAEGRTFDAVVLDPPKLARNRGGLTRALKGYSRFNQLGVALLRPGGILVTCSCSGHVTRADFSEMLSDVARTTKRDIKFLEQHGQPCDHPVSATCPETEYLKMFICQVD